MARAEIAIISTPGIGNFLPAVEFATQLTKTYPTFSATILIIDLPERPLVNDYVNSLSPSENLRFLHLTPVESPSQSESSIGCLSLLIQSYKQQVKLALTESTRNSVPLVGLFIDMFCTSMIDIADELGIPSYLYFASPATFLQFMLHLPDLDSKVKSELTHLTLPGFTNSVPVTVLPNFFLHRNDDGYSWFLHHACRYKETKGIVINTFLELEPFALNSLTNSPPVYPIGPLIDHIGPAGSKSDRFLHNKVIKWLDNQPLSSVVFLCFGSMGSLSVNQIQEIAFGLEKTGYRFLWSIREPPKAEKGKLDLPTNYTNLEDILPDGFIDRTEKIGLVCGWVPQVKVLAHKSIGGFVSHCGWNSILESLWYGVPIATWPIYAEQQMNAFEIVKELNLAVDIRLDYRTGDLVLSSEIEEAVLKLMNGNDMVKQNVHEMSKMCKIALSKNGSSYESLTRLVNKLARIN